MIRLVLSPEGEVAIDLAETSFGRGAHVHPSPDCFAKAPKGLSRSFRQQVSTSAADLARSLSESAERRVRGLLSSAARSKRAVIGGDAVASALDAAEVELLVVARDAAAAARLTSVQREQ